ncbi:MAG: hypothetical protein HY696_00645 [Deltaproteobacteria bacterium]|nr:hypothetical protein [Deltaproteobacteria bacterium]
MKPVAPNAAARFRVLPGQTRGGTPHVRIMQLADRLGGAATQSELAEFARITGPAPERAQFARFFTDRQVTASQRIAHALLAAETIDDAVRVVVAEYPEMGWLTGSVSATPELGGYEQATGTKAFVSERLFGTKHVEFDRTALGIMTFLWVLKGDYASFTACQNATVKLTEASFHELQAYTHSILQSHPEAVDSLIVYMLALDALTAYTVVNDLGKVVSMVQFLVEQSGLSSVDHDKILYDLLSRHPHVSPSFHRLPERYQQLILNGLKAVFNMGQFMQAENVPASLLGLIGLDSDSMDFYFLHFIYDLAGAAGHGTQKGSAVLIEGTFQAFKTGVITLDGLNHGLNPTQVYDQYLTARAERVGLNPADATDRVVARACCMFAVFTAEEAAPIKAAFLSLPENTRAILESEMQRTGLNDGHAILPYYGPALLRNLRTALGKLQDPDPLHAAARIGLTTLARVYIQGRVNLKRRPGNGVYTINLNALAQIAGASPHDLEKSVITLRPVGTDAAAEAGARPVIHETHLEPLPSLAALPGQRIAVVAIGGGSDGVQAGIVGTLLRHAGKNVAGVLSVRTEIVRSQGRGGTMGERRRISNHGGEVSDGVIRMTPESEGSLEHLPARVFPTHLVLDNEANDGTLLARLQASLAELRDVDTILAVDTGGDALYSITGMDQAKATPDQDLRVLQTLTQLGLRVLSMEVAPGIDSPDNAQAVLAAAHARYYRLTPEERDLALATYDAWDFTGRNPARYGKTAFAWQAALQSQTGLVVVPIVSDVVLDPRNPWIPFVHVDPSMAHLFVMTADDHLTAIGVES